MYVEVKNTKQENLHGKRRQGVLWMRGVLLGLGIWALVGLNSPSPSQAVDFHCPSGDVACLINAINVANANGEADTIILAENGSYTLASTADARIPFAVEGNNGLPSITTDITIQGNGSVIERAANLFTAPDRCSSALDRDKFRIIHVAETGTLTLADLTLQNGCADEVDGGTFVDDSGGGIFNGGTITVTNSTITGNKASAETAASFGGGIYSRGTITVTYSTISDNTADVGGGIMNERTLTIINSTISGNTTVFEGGGIRNGFIAATAQITNSTISANTAANGGGIMNVGTLMLTNSTIADNKAVTSLGGGGIYIFRGVVESVNTIIAGNSAPFRPDCFGNPTSLGNNLIGNNSGCGFSPVTGDLVNVDPEFGPFMDDGTPGNGHWPLLATSQTIDAGNDAACPPTDQLGTPRPVELGAPQCDIGAIEFAELVNEVFALTELTTAFNPTPGPDAPAGVFTITATFTHTGGPAISQPFFKVMELSGQNVLLNANGEPGGVGATLTPTVPSGGVQSGETFTAVFGIGLQELKGFTFFVDLYGVPQE